MVEVHPATMPHIMVRKMSRLCYI